MIESPYYQDCPVYKNHDIVAQMTENSTQTQSLIELIDQIERDINTLIYEISSQTTDQLFNPPPREQIFQFIPIINKLREAVKTTKESKLALTPRPKKKKSSRYRA